MSNAVKVVETLVQLGTLVRDAAQDESSGKTDWAAFLESDSYEELRETVERLLDRIGDDAIGATIERIKSKQASLLAPADGDLTKLSSQELIGYSELGNARLVLSARAVAVAADRDFFAWLVDEALPTLLRVAPIILPLLL